MKHGILATEYEMIFNRIMSSPEPDYGEIAKGIVRSRGMDDGEQKWTKASRSGLVFNDTATGIRILLETVEHRNTNEDVTQRLRVFSQDALVLETFDGDVEHISPGHWREQILNLLPQEGAQGEGI